MLVTHVASVRQIEICKEDERFLSWLTITEKLQQVPLRDLLIMPVQRLPRYVMLLEQVGLTPPCAVDSDLTARHALISSVSTLAAL